MAQYGRLKEFDADSEPITAYLERVELFFEANGVADGKRVPILLIVLNAPECVTIGPIH